MGLKDLVYCMFLGIAVMVGGIGWAGFIITSQEARESRRLVEESSIRLKQANLQITEMMQVMDKAERVVEELRKEAGK